ncbi:CAAX prenyl protease 1, putative,metallo-peptidase, clan M-, family M48, putative [Trypanosoma cruzi]|uniref:CAAX prenyl protease n=2 Tax=Trypanosoma cruzi TaxID=5693 RepID=V5DQF4_TRYCR|nr:CAAX prenyl protease 1, putative,metallo-peptidase, clan M-, family M48, putative [Trypanosoma cruzi]ESS69646.1 CAAX prenyl protease 1 [Trypanosoma cruzi Dm28c]PBJ73457.1 CAAX prenyl protease 1, metallo-peptidase, clan M, family M48 [Trypanosoma cruzi cruzi]KAF8283945.1 metallo- peptidase, Clan M- Family M48 [Trypanosoma cruzi]PWV02682.1 putative CAAX prenyl protease 1 [Trypanosoma cruzi]
MYLAGRPSFYASALIGTNAVAGWELYLQYRQWRSFFREELPESHAGIVEDEEFQKSQAYGRDKGAFAICCDVRDLILGNVAILIRLSARTFDWVAKLLPVAAGSFTHCCALTAATDVASTLMSLPFDYYKTFVIEEKHGFNKTSRKEFFKDAAKGLCLRVFLLHPLTTGLILQVVWRFGDRFPLYLFLGATGLAMAFTFLYPTLIQPLFNTYTPISEDSALYKKISILAKSHQFPLEKLYQVDGSRRSSHSNAYVYGFWKSKRIVLYDTLIEQMEGDDDLILSLLCHELGHWKHSHTIILLGIGIAQLFCISFGAKAVIFNPEIYEEFGFRQMNPFVGFTLFLSVVAEPLLTLFGYAFSLLSRQLEFQADKFAVESGYGMSLRKGLLIMQKTNKSEVSPDNLYAAMKYTHPPIAERIAAIDAEIKKSA